MSAWNQSLKTNRRLWAVATAAVFVLVGFFGLMPIKGERTFAGYWDLWAMCLHGFLKPDAGDRALALVFLLIIGCVLAVPALAIGWVVQAVVVVMRSWFAKDVSPPPT